MKRRIARALRGLAARLDPQRNAFDALDQLAPGAGAAAREGLRIANRTIAAIGRESRIADSALVDALLQRGIGPGPARRPWWWRLWRWA